MNCIHRCGKCRRFLKYISAKPQRLYCANCDETYSLPQGGTIKLYKVGRELDLSVFDFQDSRKIYNLQ